MSVTANMDLQLSQPTNNGLIVSKIIPSFFESGWIFDNGSGMASYLPIGDDDSFDWQSVKISDAELMVILNKKDSLKELIGVVMTWKDSEVGGEFLFRQDGTISINFSINRKKTLNDFTDVNWYVEKILPVFNSCNLIIESYEFSEFL